MGLKAGNPVVGGTVLMREAIRSPNFLAGVSGWTINQDGSAEFDNLTFRGTFDGANFEINGTGIFFYSGTPARGTLIGSLTNGTGTDRFGNHYVAGSTVYSVSNPFVAVGMADGFLTFYSASTAGGVLISEASIEASGNEIAIIGGGLNTGGSLTVPAGGANVTGGTDTDTAAISSGQAAGNVLQVTNTTPAPTASSTRLTAAAAADRILGIKVTGDSVDRMVIDSNGLIQWGPGNVARDTSLYRAGAGNLASDPITMNVGGSPETWHNFGAFATGLSATAAKYRFNPSNGALDISIRNLAITGTATVTDGATILTSANGLPAAYRPATPKRFTAYCNQLRQPSTGVFESCALEIETDGSIQCFGIAAAATRLDCHFAGIPIDI